VCCVGHYYTEHIQNVLEKKTEFNIFKNENVTHTYFMGHFVLFGCFLNVTTGLGMFKCNNSVMLKMECSQIFKPNSEKWVFLTCFVFVG